MVHGRSLVCPGRGVRQILDNVSGLVRRLLAFKVSKEAKTESEKFMELSRIWSEITADLQELDKLEALNHEPTISAVGGMLPSLVSKNRYIVLRLKMLGEGYDELQIFTEFMKAERKLQKAMERMHTKPEDTNTNTKKETGHPGQCANCGKSNHSTAACYSRKKPNKSHSSQGSTNQSKTSPSSNPQKIPCPACKIQHLVQGLKEQYYGSRLSACPTFRNLSLQDRTTVVEKCKACVLCLDWRGIHSRDQCPAMAKGKPFPNCTKDNNGVVCGKRHNSLLHGSTSHLCNVVVRNMAMPPSRSPNYLAPGKMELETAEESQNALLPIQQVQVGGASKPCVVFFDSGSNINLVRHAFAQELGLPGTPVTQHLQVTGKQPEQWDTFAYRVPLQARSGEIEHVIAFGIAEITADLPPTNLARVDLLLGIHEAWLFPTLVLHISTPRTELRGLLLLTRLITSILPGFNKLPSRISLFGDSKCTISAVKCEQKILEVWFGNRVAEIRDHMTSWRSSRVQVDELHHWPGESNPADLPTRGKANYHEIGPLPAWQQGPPILSQPRNLWPASRDFVRQVPLEETSPALFTTNLVSKPTVLPAIIHLHSLVTEVMQYSNSLPKVLAILARVLAANKSQSRTSISLEPSVYYLSLAENLGFIVASAETDPLVKAGKLDGMAPYWSCGRWNTRGRLGKGAFKVLGVSEFPILTRHSRLAYLIMIHAHEQDHKGSKVTLWRSRAKAWIWRGASLATTVTRNCLTCRAKSAILTSQRMGNYPEERISPDSKPFTAICIDLLGPTIVKAMANKRAHLKVWPILFFVPGHWGPTHTSRP